MLHVRDMKKAVAFYRDKLGFKVEDETAEWSELRLNKNISLALYKVNEPGSGIGFAVGNCEKATQHLESKGVKISNRCMRKEKDGLVLTQFLDPDGNVLWMAEKISKA